MTNLDTLTDAVFEAVNEDVNNSLAKHVTEVTEVEGWPGDCTASYEDGLRDVIRQLVENALAHEWSDTVGRALTVATNAFSENVRAASSIRMIVRENIGGGSMAAAIYFGTDEAPEDEYVWVTDLADHADAHGYVVGYYPNGNDDGTEGIMFDAHDDDALRHILVRLVAERAQGIATCGGCGEPSFAADDSCLTCGFPRGDLMAERGWEYGPSMD